MSLAIKAAWRQRFMTDGKFLIGSCSGNINTKHLWPSTGYVIVSEPTVKLEVSSKGTLRVSVFKITFI